MGLHEYIRMNMEPILYNMCVGVCVRVQCTLYIYPLKSIKNGSYLWPIYVYFTILAGLALKRPIHTLNQSPSRRNFFFWFSKQERIFIQKPEFK